MLPDGVCQLDEPRSRRTVQVRPESDSTGGDPGSSESRWVSQPPCTGTSAKAEVAVALASASAKVDRIASGGKTAQTWDTSEEVLNGDRDKWRVPIRDGYPSEFEPAGFLTVRGSLNKSDLCSPLFVTNTEHSRRFVLAKHGGTQGFAASKS